VFDGPNTAQPGTRIVVRLRNAQAAAQLSLTDTKGVESAVTPTAAGTIEIDIPADAAPGTVLVLEENLSDETHVVEVTKAK
jgi:uncharacterized protein (DUF1684 family)